MTTFYADFDLTTGANDGSSASDAFQSEQDIYDAMFAGSVVGSDLVICCNTDTLGSTPTIAKNIDPVNPVIFEGRNSSFVDDGTRAVVDCGSSYNALLCTATSGGIIYKNFEFKNSSGNMFDESAGSLANLEFINCIFTNAGNNIFDQLDNIKVSNCYISGTTGRDFSVCIGVQIDNSFFISGYACLFQCQRYCITNTIVHDYSIGDWNTDALAVKVNVIYDTMSLHGVYANNLQNFNVSVRLTNMTGNGITCPSSSDGSSYSGCFFYNPSGTDLAGADLGNLRDLGNNRLTGDNTSDGYVNLVAHDFRVIIGGEGVGVLTPAGLEEETTNIFALTAGIPPEYAASGGGLLYHPGMSGGMRG